MISANAASVGRAALVAVDAKRVLASINATAALAFEGFRANLSPLDPRAQRARQVPGQADVARELQVHLEGSALNAPGAARRVQDPLSLRCVTQVHGALAWSLEAFIAQIELELNSAADSPLVVADDGVMLSNGNFHLPVFALCGETVALAMAQVATLAVERCLKLLSPDFTGLPLQLTRHGPAHSGFSTVQKTLTALANRLRQLANPVCLDFLPVSDDVEDHATMAWQVVEKLEHAIAALRSISAIEWLIAAQAIDLRGKEALPLGKGTAATHALLRQTIAPLDVDRPIGPDIGTADALIATGALERALDA